MSRVKGCLSPFRQRLTVAGFQNWKCCMCRRPLDAGFKIVLITPEDTNNSDYALNLKPSINNMRAICAQDYALFNARRASQSKRQTHLQFSDALPNLQPQLSPATVYLSAGLLNQQNDTEVCELCHALVVKDDPFHPDSQHFACCPFYEPCDEPEQPLGSYLNYNVH